MDSGSNREKSDEGKACIPMVYPNNVLITGNLGSVESTDGTGIGRQNDGTEAGESAYG